MATSPESFQQVKDILRKLDRSIDAARTRRLGESNAPSPSVTVNEQRTAPFDPASTTIGISEQAGGSSLVPARPTNRARPLIRDRQH